MSRLAKPFTISRRNDSKTFLLTLNDTCGLPKRVCDEWSRKSFHKFPAELANHRNPKTKAAAEAAAFALITYLKKKQEEGNARRVSVDDITVGDWIKKFTELDTSPRTGINASKNKRQTNPFQYIEKPSYYKTIRDALTEDEMVKLFMPGVLTDTMELAVCAAIFLSGLRRAEVSALRPEDLDWKTPKITVCQSWQLFNSKNKVLGPTKGKKERKAPFDPILQAAIKKLWQENGEHEYVFCLKDGKTIGSSWIIGRFPKWLKRAGIELGGRNIVPHSSRHSLASLLEEKGVSLRYIQDLLGHSDLKTTYIYLHSPEKIIRDIGKTLSEEIQAPEQKTEEKIIEFKVS
jgi:integrase